MFLRDESWSTVRVSQEQLVRVGLTKPTVGHHVHIHGGHNLKAQIGAIMAVHDDETIDVQVLDTSSGHPTGPMLRKLNQATAVRPPQTADVKGAICWEAAH